MLITVSATESTCSGFCFAKAVICGPQLPSSSSCMTRAADPPLFQRRIHRGEFGIEGGADAVDGGDDDDAEADRDQAIFDCRGAGLIAEESRNQPPHFKLLSTLAPG